MPTWRKWSGNSYEIIELLRKAEYYLWGKTNEKDVIEAADRISALVQGYDYGTNSVPFMAGMSAVRAAYAVTLPASVKKFLKMTGKLTPTNGMQHFWQVFPIIKEQQI